MQEWKNADHWICGTQNDRRHSLSVIAIVIVIVIVIVIAIAIVEFFPDEKEVFRRIPVFAGNFKPHQGFPYPTNEVFSQLCSPALSGHTAVMAVKMFKRVIRQKTSGLFLAAQGGLTDNLDSAAEVFGRSNIQKLCHEMNLGQMEIVIFIDGHGEITIPVGEPSPHEAFF